MSDVQLAQEALQARNYDRAAQLAARLLVENPDSLPALRIAAEARAQLGRVDDAIKAAERLADLDTPDPKLLGFLSSLYWRAGRIADAATRCKQLVGIAPHSAGAYNSLGMCLLSLKDWDGAVDAFGSAVKLNPDWADFRHNYAGALDEAGDWNEAIVQHSKALELKPELYNSMFALADLHVRLANAESAKHIMLRLEGKGLSLDPEARLAVATELLNRLLEAEPSHARARGLLASILQQQGRHEEANAELERSIGSDPNVASTYWHLTRGKTLQESDRPMVEKMQALLLKERPDKEKQLLHNALGKALNDLKEYDAALEHFDQAHRIAHSKNKFDREAFRAQTDAIISFFNRSLFNRLGIQGLQTELPVLVVGMPRSGTTLTEQILASHPEVAGGGELPFWPDFGKKVWTPESKDLGFTLAKQLADLYVQALKQISSEAVRVIDKNPYNYRNVGLVHLLLPNARFIYCLRHPVDNCLSLYMANFSYPPAYAHDRGDLVFAYREHLRLLEHWETVIPKSRFTVVRYEDLIEQRETETRRLIEFCGLEWNEACLYPERNERVVLTASQWQVRQPVYRTSMERWKRYEKGLGEFRELL